MPRGGPLTPAHIAKMVAARKAVIPPTAVRYWTKVDKRGPDECWPWLGAKNPDGYGRFWAGGKLIVSHHYPLIEQGITPPKYPMVCDHICKDRGCQNPAHLRIVHQGVNTTENSESVWAKNKAKTRCKYGHLLAGLNVAIVELVYKSGRVGISRYCLTCFPSYWNHPRRTNKGVPPR